MADPQFGVADYIVLAAIMIVSSLIGLFYRFTGGQQKTSSEYLLADGNMSVLPVAFSLMASFMSAITLLGVTQENYSYGTQFVCINLAYVLSTPVAAYIFLPVFYNLKSPSVYKYLEDRFGKIARITASLAFSVQMFLYMGIVLYAPSLALSAVTGLSFEGSVIGVGLVCTFYSTVGGMKAVLMTDLFQSLLMFSAVLTVIFSTCLKHSVLEVFGGCFVYCSLYAVNQAQVQRLMTLPTLAQAQAALWIQVPILMCLSLLTSFAGLCIFFTYKDCDPFLEGRIQKSDQLFPIFILDQLAQIPGLAGLAVGGIFSGSLSTVSSAINSLAAVTLEDYIKPCCTVPENRSTLVLKGLALGYGLACIGLAFLADLLGTGVLQASLTIFGVVGGPLLGLFALGMLTRISGQAGAVTGLLTGLIFVSWIGFGGPKPPVPKLSLSISNCSNPDSDLMWNSSTWSSTATLNPTWRPTNSNSTELNPETEYFYLYRISYAWYSMIGFLITVGVGLLVSVLYSKISGFEPELVEDNLLSHLTNRSSNKSYRVHEAFGDTEKPEKIQECKL
ncbi:putative sodium-dependent multivitamin transporter isoform X2 [Eurytemora carolleeae]|uniref:putative sodium-dependent multivitamin transporter isoform X2 n=1 Tax=Eurytemora carolleeae TaxID=1294199 RepID=UPI000C775894|nr:putative sodium-dependent multivitamin transporter isoform X2 [Eurytemora carolleeae]|eukprot:XP_023341743.1 putative sodium-dependent multivitamin transporter isoform X2 [Eurytemora affinis]